MRYVKYVVAAAMAVGLFWVVWGMQYVWWFPEEAFGSVINMAVNEAEAVITKSAVEVKDSASLAEAMAKHDWEKSFSFLGVCTMPNAEKVYVTVDTSFEDRGSLSSAQKRAFDEFLLSYSSRRAQMIDRGLPEYLKMRDEREKQQKADSQRTRATTFGPVILPAKLTPQNLDPGKCSVWLELDEMEKGGLAYTAVEFRAPNNAFSRFTVYMHGDNYFTQEEFFKEKYGRSSFFGDDDDEEESEENTETW